MPIYEYRCAACGHHLEALQKMSDGPLRKCPDCGKSQLKRLVSAPRFRLKGGGWYETDFKNDGETKRNLVETAGRTKPPRPSTRQDRACDRRSGGAKTDGAKADGAEKATARRRAASAKEGKPKRRNLPRRRELKPAPKRRTPTKPRDANAPAPLSGWRACLIWLPDRRDDPDLQVPARPHGSSADSSFRRRIGPRRCSASASRAWERFSRLLDTARDRRARRKSSSADAWCVWYESWLGRIPIVRTVYGGVKKFAAVLLSDKRHVVQESAARRIPAARRLQDRASRPSESVARDRKP